MAGANIDLKKYIDVLQSLDTKNIGGWPTWVYGFICAVITAAIIGLGIQFLIKPERELLAAAQAEEARLKQDFEAKQKKVANLEAYKAQLTEMEREFGGMLRQLPSKAEIANLLNDVSQTRVATGLEEELFQPQAEVPKEFYAEVPIQLNVVGLYHELADFASGVSALPRIVTLHEINIATKDKAPAGRGAPIIKAKTDQTENDLRMTLTAKTYRYLDDEELVEAAKAEAANKPQGAR